MPTADHIMENLNLFFERGFRKDEELQVNWNVELIFMLETLQQPLCEIELEYLSNLGSFLWVFIY